MSYKLTTEKIQTWTAETSAPFSLILREMLVKQSLFHGGGVLLPLPQNGNRSWACLTCMELQCWCPSGPCGQELSCRGGGGWGIIEAKRTLKHKEKLSSNPFAFFALSPIKLTLSSTAQISEGPWSRSGGEATAEGVCRTLARLIWHKRVLCQQHLQMTDL